MATTKKHPEAAEAPATVKLHSKDLGKTKEFSPEHAAALLKYQTEKGYTHWQPVAADETTSE